jgi:hypothetical protein
MYLPDKYFRGLTAKKKVKRVKEIQRFGAKDWKSSAAYTGFATDKGVKTRKSSYSSRWEKRFPNVKSLEDRSKVTGVPLKFIEECYNRGMAAWRTGHRPGATQQQWGYARVSSFLLCGKTSKTADADLVKKASTASASAKKWFSQCA